MWIKTAVLVVASASLFACAGKMEMMSSCPEEPDWPEQVLEVRASVVTVAGVDKIQIDSPGTCPNGNNCGCVLINSGTKAQIRFRLDDGFTSCVGLKEGAWIWQGIRLVGKSIYQGGAKGGVVGSEAQCDFDANTQGFITNANLQGQIMTISDSNQSEYEMFYVLYATQCGGKNPKVITSDPWIKNRGNNDASALSCN